MIKFGPSGNSESFYALGHKHSEESAKYVKEMGLDLFEYSFGRGVNMGEAKALSIGNAFRENDVEISVHAPYFINFAGEEENIEKSYGYVINSAKMLAFLGGKRIAVPISVKNLFMPCAFNPYGKINLLTISKELPFKV